MANLNLVLCGLLLSPLAVTQHVVTVSVGTCFSSQESMSSFSPGGPGPSAPPSSGAFSTSSQASATVSASSVPSSTPPGFLIAFAPPSNSRLRRREEGGFPTLDGQSTDACIHSPLFNVDAAGQLSVVNAGTSMTYSTSPGKASAPFAPSSNVGNISTTWQLVGGMLVWKNSLFLNGTAVLCSEPSGAVDAYFLEPIPADCAPLSLAQTPVSTCPGYFEANPNGILAPFNSTSSELPSSSPSTLPDTGASATGGTTSLTEPSSTSAVLSPILSLPSPQSSSQSITSPSIVPSSVASGGSIPDLPPSIASLTSTPFFSNVSTSAASIIASLPVTSNSSTSATSFIAPPLVSATSILSSPLPGATNSSTPITSLITPSPPAILNSTSILAGTSTPLILSALTSNVTTLTSALLTSSSPSSSSAPSLTLSSVSSSAVSTSSATGSATSSIIPSSSSSLVKVTITTVVSSGTSQYTTFLNTASQTVVEEIVQSTPGPVTVTTTVSSGSSLYTTFVNAGGRTVTEEIVQPTPFTTTISSASSFYTTSTILPGGQEEVEIIEPQSTTTTTSYTAYTTIYTATATGTDDVVTVTVVEPTPGMQYFGFKDPGDHYKSSPPDSSQFNNNASRIDVQGYFPGNVNFYTANDGSYQFPQQTTTTLAADYAVALEGYFYGPAGDYAVTMSTQNDDYGFLWTASRAYSGWNNNNAEVTESIAGGYTQNHTFTLTAGQFLPMTLLWSNVGGSGGLRFVIYPPGGADAVVDTTGWFVQPYAGDGFVYHWPQSH